MMATFDDIPLIDDHAHPMLPPEVATRDPFVRYFSEAHDVESITRHAPHTLLYRQALQELSAFLDCEASDEAVVAARAALPFDAYLRRLMTDANVETVLLDDGYPRTGALSVAETVNLGGVRAGRILRVERLIEDLIPAAASLADLEVALTSALEAARPGLVGLKSIIAYRTGLVIEPVDAAVASAALGVLQVEWGGTPRRLASKPLLDHLVPRVAEWAASRDLPLQFHTGFGDRDLDLRLANPAHLRPLLERGALSRGPVVLLHTCYPYQREAAYLAHVYPNVFVDLSEASPLLAGPGLTRVFEELLALAPVTKLLYGSDAWAVPEWFWLAARASRRALAEALAWLPASDQRWAARRVLHDNAAELYRLGE